MAIAHNNYSTGLRLPTSVWLGSGGRANILLNTAYVNGTSGAGVAVRYQAREATPITELYVMLDDIAGTLGSITMGCILYNEHASSVTQPGTTVRATASTVTMPSAVDKWIRIVFSTPYTPSLGEVLWFVLRNTSGAPTVDYPMILTATNYNQALNLNNVLAASAYSSTAGFSAAGTAQARMPHVVMHGANAYGIAVTNAVLTVYPASTAMRGFQITPPMDVEVSGWQCILPTTAFSGLRIYDASVAPGGSALYTFPLGSDTNQQRDELIGAKVFAPVLLTAGVSYNIVTAYASAAAVQTGVIEDYASFPAVFDLLLDNFTICPAVSDVGGVWTLRKDAYPPFQLLVTNFPAPTVRRPRVWNGVSWQEKPMGVWNGTTWEEQPFKVWDGSDWI